jgi:hypothetical protein
MSSTSDDTSKISPNSQDPESLFLGDAIAHLTQGRLFRVVRRPLLAVPLALACCGFFYFHPPAVLALLGGFAASFLAASLAYLSSYARFAQDNQDHGTLCPRCASRMWQFCCARCREPVPPLAFLWRGALLSSCPHCGYWLSSDAGTLLAWCSTCSHVVRDPHRFYTRPNHLIMMAVGRLPSEGEIPAPWRLASSTPTRLVLYYPPDDHSASLMFVVDSMKDDLRFDYWVVDHTRLLLVSDDAPDAVAAAFRAIFPTAIFERTAAGVAVNAGVRLATETNEEQP